MECLRDRGKRKKNSIMGGRALHFLEGKFRVNPLFTLNYLAINDGYDGQYCQIGVIKYFFRLLTLF